MEGSEKLEIYVFMYKNNPIFHLQKQKQIENTATRRDA